MKKIIINLMFLVTGCLSIVSCMEQELEMEMTIDLSDFKLVPNGGNVNVQDEAKCLMEVGSEITIVVLGDLGSGTIDWVSDNPEVASVEHDKITALKTGEAKITDANGSSKVISVIVQK